MAKKKNTTAVLQLNMFAGVNTTAALNAQIADIEKKITALYGSTYKFAAQIAQVRAAVAAGQEFSFADNQAAAKQIEQRLAAIATTLDQQLGKATERSFALGQASTEHALTNALGTDKPPRKRWRASPKMQPQPCASVERTVTPTTHRSEGEYPSATECGT